MEFTAPVTHHASSDDCGVAILGQEIDGFWKDHKGAMVNAIRTRTLIAKADIVIVRFGEKYRQWNAAFDAGFAAALGKPLVVLHPEEFNHALKEIDGAALAVAREPEQVVSLLRYVIDGTLVSDPFKTHRPQRRRRSSAALVRHTMEQEHRPLLPA